MSTKIIDLISKGIHAHLKSDEPAKARDPHKLWARDLNTKCSRRLWYETHTPSIRTKYDESVGVKFLLGDAVESVMDYLFEKGGSKPHSHQLRVEHKFSSSFSKLDVAISGKIDFIVDDTIVEVKSINEWGFAKFVKDMPTLKSLSDSITGAIAHDMYTTSDIHTSADPLGYLHQLSFYVRMLQINGVLLVVNKNSGEIATFRIPKGLGIPLAVLESKADILHNALLNNATPPARTQTPITEANGNVRLNSVCTYCPFKTTCWPGLRAFEYADGIKYYTEIVKVPRVSEITTI